MTTPAPPPPIAPAAARKPFPTKLVAAAVVAVVALVVVYFVAFPAARYQQVVNQNGPPTATLSAGQWQGGNLTITVTAVGGSYAALANDIGFWVYDANETPLFIGDAGDPPSSGSGVNLTYDDLPGTGHGDVSVGDTITLHGPSPSPAAHGRLMMHVHAGTQIATVNLP